MLAQIISKIIIFLTNHKDLFLSLQNIAAVIALIIGAVWAIRRISFERPFQSSIDIDLSSTTLAVADSIHLLHVEVIIKNIGHSATNLGEDLNKKFRSWIKIIGIKKKYIQSEMRTLPGSFMNPIEKSIADQYFINIYNGPFVDLFIDWFESTRYVTLEAGEAEQYSANFYISTDIYVIDITTKIYETKVRKKRLKRPFYWLVHKVFPC